MVSRIIKQDIRTKIAKQLVSVALIPLVAIGVTNAAAQESASDGLRALEEVVVTGVRARLEQAGALKDIIEQTEFIGNKALESTQSLSLADALGEAPGADVAIDCSMCGFKRLRLNGLRAEHTNLLIDGLPVHTVVSGFYGLDSVSMTGVERVEIARGAGSSLTAPEAIGGVVNVITQDAYEDGGYLEIAGGETGYAQINALGTLISDDARTRATFYGQIDQRDQTDQDNNGVSENPGLDNSTISAKISHDFSDRDNIVVRLTAAEQESFGGPVLGNTTSSIGAALNSAALGEADQLFQNNNVNDRWVGNAWETTEWVDTSRREAAVSWLHEASAKVNWQLALSYADNSQDSFYEGYSYLADNDMYYVDGHINYLVNDQHRLTFGVDYRDEVLDSALVDVTSPSRVFSDDSFTHDIEGLYIQDVWTPNEHFDLKAAIRFDSVSADLAGGDGVEIDETILSPRVDMRYLHNDAFTSRLSFGTGYRAPLSFFESDHGLLDDPIQMDIDDLEKSVSIGYALSYGDSRTSATLSLARTEVDNLATIGDNNTLTQVDEKGVVFAVDLALGYRISDALLLNLVIESYDYDDVFQDVYGIVPLEEGASITLDYDLEGWDIYGTLNWVGSRDLTAYGYEGYDQIDAAGYIIEDSVKISKSPSYITLDFRAAKEINDNFSAYIGVNNLLNYTQAGEGESPLFWVAGDRDEIGLQSDGFDVTYIHGPLRGREFYAGFTYNF
ncbi:MAG: TonB-dependent receptor [Acidiferrobacterales bacterium]|nr:TonB-dependent receptor [Acidiferrobacterales bacterium]